jgi:TolB-like protein/DNA-binding winged helix-turn-helix (wHTH) protein/Tfp pilus assembly protein PilF
VPLGTQDQPRPRVVFGDYELDCRTGVLSHNGVTLALQPQPAKVLSVLVGRAGEVVTREELAAQVWGSDTHVDFEHGLNFAVRKIRKALEDDADKPRYLETIPRRGYRFIATVREPANPVETEPSRPLSAAARGGWRRLLLVPLAAAVVAIAIVTATHVWPHKAAAGHIIGSLAVLPLHNLSRDPDQEYFSEGITDELITDLAKMPKLKVISHTSVERYKDTKRPLPEIARELGADAVVEGTIVRSGDRVRITAQLIDAQSDQHLWAESYEQDVRDLLQVQDQLANEIAREIGVNLVPSEHHGQSQAKAKVDPAAYEAYLKGIFYLGHASCKGFETALSYFQMATDKDPSFAPAISGLADTYFGLGDWRCWHTEPFDRAEIAASKAIELEPRNARAHAVLAEVGFARDWNWVGPAEQFATAIDLDPNDAGIHSRYGMFLVAIGKEEQGLAEERKAQELDPYSVRTNDTHTWTLYLAHRFDEAIDHAKHALAVSPAYGQYYWLGQCYERKNMPDQAVENYLKAMSGMPKELPLRRAAYEKAGLAGYWEEDERLRKLRKERIDAVFQAMYYAHRGKKAKAIEQLELAYQQHCDGLQFLKVEPVYDSLRDDPKFKALLMRLGL